MTTPRWYMVNKMGMATLCKNKKDAAKEARAMDMAWPHMGPHRAVQLVEAADVEALRTGYAAARLEIESLQARIKTMAEEHADELMVAHLDGRMRAAQPAGAQQPGAGTWTPLPGTLPEPGKPVLLDIGKEYPIRAMWAAKHTLEVGVEDDSGFGEYDEATGTYYCPEGWYEWNEHEEIHWAVNKTPTAWCELPPNGGASHGQAPAQAAPAAVHSALRARCVEVLAWQETGTLPGEALRTLAREKYGDRYDALQRAERDTETEALNLVAAAPTNQPAPQQEPSYTAVQLAELVLSDCGHSSNYTPLLDRVAARIDSHTERRLDELRRCLESKQAPQADSVTAPASGANWQDISTAPKDGTRFVAVGQNYGLDSEKQHTCIAQWLAGCWVEVSDWNGASKLKYLTHWMPLPPLPGSAARAPADSVLEDAARLEFEMQHGSAIAAARKQGAKGVVMHEPLKDCPFCGGAASLHNDTDSPCWFVGCSNSACPIEPCHYADTEAEAIATWNRRTPTPVAVPLLDAARKQGESHD